MQAHILAAMREQADRWEELLSADPSLAHLPTLGDWTTKDVMAHLWAWQQATSARVEAALRDREPVFPTLLTEVSEDWEGQYEQTNAHIYEVWRTQPWTTVHDNWRQGYLHLLELAARLPEVDLLDTGKFPWLNGWAVAFVLVASYEHHREHYDKLLAWMHDHGRGPQPLARV